MLTITVTRKPLDGTVAVNALKHGTGGLNIDGTRIASHSMPQSALVPGWDSINARNAQNGYRDLAYTQGHVLYSPSHAGRWPANLILSHMPGCQRKGTKTIPGYSINQWDDGAKPFGGGAGHQYTTTKKAAPEVITTYLCDEGCPVAALDAQSDERPGMLGGGAPIDNANKKTGKKVIPSFNRKPSAQFIRSDTGGASRFFKQVDGHV